MTFVQTTYTPYDEGAAAPLPKVSEPLVATVPSSATPSINCDHAEFFTIAALAVAITGVTITGSPGNGQVLRGRIKDNGTARAIAWGAAFEAGSVALPTTTVQGKTLAVEFVYDAVDAKWACEKATSRA